MLHTLPFAAEKEAVARAAKLAAITEHTTFRVLVLDWRELDQAEAQIVAAVQGLAVVVPAPLADVYDDADLLDTW